MTEINFDKGKCKKCGVAPELIAKYCKVVNGRRFCYKDGGCAKCNVDINLIRRYCRSDQFGSVCFIRNVKPHIDAAKAVLFDGCKLMLDAKGRLRIIDKNGVSLSEPITEKKNEGYFNE